MVVPGKTPYAVLGINAGSKLTDVKKAWRKMALEHHPDKGGDAENFEKVQKAYEKLCDPAFKNKLDSDMDFKSALRNYRDGNRMKGDLKARLDELEKEFDQFQLSKKQQASAPDPETTPRDLGTPRTHDKFYYTATLAHHFHDDRDCPRLKTATVITTIRKDSMPADSFHLFGKKPCPSCLKQFVGNGPKNACRMKPKVSKVKVVTASDKKAAGSSDSAKSPRLASRVRVTTTIKGKVKVW